jgi:hypothetical protein
VGNRDDWISLSGRDLSSSSSTTSSTGWIFSRATCVEWDYICVAAVTSVGRFVHDGEAVSVCSITASCKTWSIKSAGHLHEVYSQQSINFVSVTSNTWRIQKKAISYCARIKFQKKKRNDCSQYYLTWSQVEKKIRSKIASVHRINHKLRYWIGSSS